MALPSNAAPVPAGSLGGPCTPWAQLADMCDVEPEEEAQAQVALDVAQELLWALSGRQFGLCSIEGFRPPCQRQPCPHLTLGERLLWASASPSLAWAPPMLWRHPWELDLRPRVNRIFEVRIDGQALSSSAWRLDDHAVLVRTDGESWPRCQDFKVGASSPGAWALDLERGRPVPAAGRLACATLASELFAGMCGSSKCRLPRRTQTITRKGVEMLLTDPMDFLEKGRTGLVEVDYFLTAVNPRGLRRRGRAYNPSALAARRR